MRIQLYALIHDVRGTSYHTVGFHLRFAVAE
jgi:hypothetical protein